MISTTAYILISTLINNGNISQSTATFADKASCEKVALRQYFALKSIKVDGRWNLTCHPYLLNEDKK